jgi:hypothetical protein
MEKAIALQATTINTLMGSLMLMLCAT